MAATHVALVRGINVGPTTKVAMADLRGVFAEFADVVTLLNSGNVVFATGSDPDPKPLERALAAASGVSARILVLPAARFIGVASANPLAAIATDDSRLVTTFLEAPVAASVPEGLDPEAMVITDAAVYQWCPNGVSKSKVPPAWWKRLGVLATARNQRTIDRIAALL